MIFVTGDTHSYHDFRKLLDPQLSTLTKQDHVIMLGDCGVVFDEHELPFITNLYEYLPFTVLFIDGNHNNHDFLKTFPVEC